MKEKIGNVLDLLIKKTLEMPGARVDRSKFLRDNLSIHVPKELVEKAITDNPSSAGISVELIDELAKHTIRYHIKLATSFSAFAGLPGGFWMAGTIPADTIQFYEQIIILSQKLAYLYGWPDLDDKNDIDQLKDMVILFIGVMMGISQFNKLIAEIARRLAIEIAKKLPRMALTKTLWYPLVKMAAKWIGINLTKEIAAKGIAKVVPFIGALTSGALTYFTMRKMARRLQKELKATLLANMKDAENIKDSNVDDPIDVEFEEVVQ